MARYAVLSHHGIKGQKWGIRRYQNADGSLTAEGKARYNKYEYDIAKKSQRIGYRSDYDRMEDYRKKSSTVRERSKELSDLAEKAKDLFDKLDSFSSDSKEVYDKASKKAWDIIKKDPIYDKGDEKYNQSWFDYLMYDKGLLKETADKVNKSNPEYKKIKSDYNDTIKKYKEKCNKIADEIIGEYGKEKVKGLGADMTYKNLVYYALSHPNTMYMFTYEDDMGLK